ncbi:MaoC family dehydratase [Leptospira ilyithenensis]|uniref:MaoC family dehydratase n=1 Tax=Leptospira ilyithenensis TaxID=2484901 RepID=A0A4R9LTA6_9LEPT|nr:MaoC family dehydratase [Leptospira ilyithenensis]TGN10900.1 MaoC family dehydratase [Leptospira ilyithenensis]
MTSGKIAEEGLYLEDLSLGRKLLSESYIVTEEEIKEFAGKYDPQDFHLNDSLAKESLFGGLAASGWHTASITMRLLVGSGKLIKGGIVGMGGEISWPRPTRPGDTLQVESEVIEVIPSGARSDQGIVKLRSKTKNQNGKVVQLFIAKLYVPRRPV